MSADAESGWAFVSVSPCVDGGDGHSEVASEFLDCEKPIEMFHGLSMPSNPLTRIPLPLQFACHSAVISTVSPGQGYFTGCRGILTILSQSSHGGRSGTELEGF